MAVTFQTDLPVERGSCYWFAPSDIDIDAQNNGRHVLPDIKWLIESIQRDGQHTPCLVRKDGSRAMLVEGHSRYRAVVEINRNRKPDDRIKLLCTYFQGNEVDALAIGFALNRERNALTPVDEGYFVVRMERFGKTVEEIASIVHEDVAWVNQRRDLTRLVGDAQSAVASGEIKLSAAKALAKLSSEEQRRALKERDKRGRVTPASIKAVSSNGHAKKPAKPSLAQVRGTLQDIVAHEKYPSGFPADAKKSPEVDVALEWFMSFIDGEGA